MKIVSISDLLIPKEYIENAFYVLDKFDIKQEVIEWEMKSLEELQKINILIEKHGSENYELPRYILKAVKDADIVVSHFCPISKKLIDYAKKIKLIGVFRKGYENINIKYATQNNILVMNTLGRNSNAVADFTVGLILAECRNIARGHMALKNGKWLKEFPNSESIPDLASKKVGIVGLGNIGLEVAKRLEGFGAKLIGYDPYVKDMLLPIKVVGLEELMRESDIVTLHIPLTDKTKNLINKDLIGLMKPNAYLINTSRAGIVDEDALYNSLKSKRIMGAALDVFNIEPTGKDYPIVNLENITVTPHLAGSTKDSFMNSPVLLFSEIAKVLNGGSSLNFVNKEILGQKNRISYLASKV